MKFEQMSAMPSSKSKTSEVRVQKDWEKQAAERSKRYKEKEARLRTLTKEYFKNQLAMDWKLRQAETREIFSGIRSELVEMKVEVIRKMAEAVGATITQITEFPEGLSNEKDDNEDRYVSDDPYFMKLNPTFCVKDSNGTSVTLISLGSQEYFNADWYEDGVFQGGNHCYVQHEVGRILNKL